MDDATVVVEAEVTSIEDGPELVSDYPGDDAAETAVPTQRIGFTTINVLSGSIPSTFKVFKTGSSDVYLKGDPLYAVGEMYLLFLEPQGEQNTFIPVAPDGRISVGAAGEAEPIIGGPIATQITGLEPEEIVEVAQ